MAHKKGMHHAKCSSAATQEEEDRQREYLEAQIERAQQSAKADEGPVEGTELHRDALNGAVPLQLALSRSWLGQSALAAPKSRAPAFQEEDRPKGGAAHRPSPSQKAIMGAVKATGQCKGFPCRYKLRRP